MIIVGLLNAKNKLFQIIIFIIIHLSLVTNIKQLKFIQIDKIRIKTIGSNFHAFKTLLKRDNKTY